MLIVFVALSLISLFIAMLPRIPGLAVDAAAAHAAPAKAARGAAPDEGDLVAAIGFVLHERARVTRRSSGRTESPHS